MKEEIRDFRGHLIGTITTDDRTGVATARDFYERIVGTYNYFHDGKTRDFYNRIVSSGNSLASLIWKADAEYKEQENKNRR